MLHRSNNLYADAIAKTVAAEYYKLPATYSRTTRAIRAVLKQYANIDLGNSYLVDGNGLSPHNLVTPHKMLEILEFINLMMTRFSSLSYYQLQMNLVLYIGELLQEIHL